MDQKLIPVGRKKIYESIVDQMRQLIVNGTWKPGMRLPSERELTQALSVGRTSVREALRILEAMGFIEIRAGDGSYVNDGIDVPERMQKLADLFKEKPENEYLVELMEARELIESQVSFMATLSATEEDITKLDQIIQQQEFSIKSGGAGIEENINFHLCLAEITGNRVLVELQQIFAQLSHKAISRLFLSPERQEESIHEHKAIALAIKEGRSVDAHQLMLDHLRHRYAQLKPE